MDPKIRALVQDKERRKRRFLDGNTRSFFNKYIEDLKNDREIYELQRSARSATILDGLLGYNPRHLCFDEIVDKSCFTRKDLNLDIDISSETDNGFGIQKAINKSGKKEKTSNKNRVLEKLFKTYSKIYLAYLHSLKLFGYPKDDLNIGKLAGLEYPIHLGIGMLNPGGIVFVPAGTYSITTTITPTNDMILTGAGTATLLDADADVSIIHGDTSVQNYADITIRDMKLLGYGSGTGYGVVFGTSTTFSTTYLNLINLKISNCGYSGVRLRTMAIEDNMNLLQKIVVTTSKSNHVGNGSGIGIYAGDYTLLSGCETYNNAGVGFYLYSTDYCSVIGCKAKKNVMHGIMLNTASDCNAIIGNEIRDNDKNDAATYDGIHVYNSDMCTIIGNKVFYNDRHQIRFENYSDLNVCIGNTINIFGAVDGISDDGVHTDGVNEIAHNPEGSFII